MLRVLRSVLVLAALTAAVPSFADAQAQNERPPATPGPHEWNPQALEAIDKLKSPYCPGFMLEVCPSTGGAALRDTIEMMAESGMPADTIVERVLAKYGEEWRALPKATGEALLAWVMPPLALLVGIAVVVIVLRRIRRPTEGLLPAAVTEAEQARLAAALRELEQEEETQF